MMRRVSVSSKTSSLVSGGSPIHSTECVNQGLGGFATYCMIRTCKSFVRDGGSHRLDCGKENKDRLAFAATGLAETDVVVGDLNHAAFVAAAGDRFDIHLLAFEAAKEIFAMLSGHSLLRFVCCVFGSVGPSHKEEAVLVGIF